MGVKMNLKFILGGLLFLSPKVFSAINPKKNNYDLRDKNIIVAVIDTGADTSHPELKNYLWINEGENGKDIFGRDKSTNKIDDDGNGFVDDFHGWNFVNNSNDVSDQHGHGTHISGVIKKGLQRHLPKSTSTHSARLPLRLMILKYYDPKADDETNVNNTAKAIDYATQMGAQIINYSGGGSSPSQHEMSAIKEAKKHSIIFVAAAGNNNTNTDIRKYYPANYKLDNIISVAATDNEGTLVSFSNYGAGSIDLAAPGKMIFSSLPHNSYGFMSGTSQATAYVSGAVAALILNSKFVQKNTILNRLLAQSKFNPSLKGKLKNHVALMPESLN